MQRAHLPQNLSLTNDCDGEDTESIVSAGIAELVHDLCVAFAEFSSWLGALRQGDGARVVDGGGLGPRNADDRGGDGRGDGDVCWAAADDWSGGVDYSDCGGRRRFF